VTLNQNCPSRPQFSSFETFPLEVIETGDHLTPSQENALEQVLEQVLRILQNYNLPKYPGLAHIEPVPAQILSLLDSNGIAIHLELDNGATCSYIQLREAIKRGFNIYPNNQSSQLGDGVTMIKSCGQVDVNLYRNSHKLRFRAIVARNLHCPVIGGTTFIKDNNIKQDFVCNQISLLGNRCTVPSTQREALLPIAQYNNTNHDTNSTTCLHCLHSILAQQLPTATQTYLQQLNSTTLNTTSTTPHRTATQPLATPPNPLISIKARKILLPGDHLTITTDLPDQEMLVEATKSNNWPPPTLAAINNKNIKLRNNTTNPILLDGKQTLSLRLTPTTHADITLPPHNTHYYGHYSPQPRTPPPDSETIQLIKFGKTEPEIKALLDSAHRQYREVFDSDLSNGYNGYFGRHLCNLN